uniref:trichohyalin isoform X2 n=1 Tax=Ciona intestinalis TaxID=7719 RepID=UPI00089DB379|nr:trichohyalin isoform X2 [Ciona intestinalis]|eukprot:XP_018667550.1 trichohyalin isoform X2 [Ciona intestinalis]
MNRSTNDMHRMMLLAGERLQLLKLTQPYQAGSASTNPSNQQQGWIGLVNLIEQKFENERKFLVSCLKDLNNIENDGSSLESKLFNLSNSWNGIKNEGSAKERIQILQQAVSVYSQLLKSHSSNPSSVDHEIMMLAQLQVHQDEDSKINMASEEPVEKLLQDQLNAVNDETLENIASLLFAPNPLTNKLLLAAAIKEKYNIIIRRLIGSSDEDVDEVWRNKITEKMEKQSQDAVESSSPFSIFGPKLSVVAQNFEKQKFGERSQPVETGTIRTLCNMCWDEIHVVMSGVHDMKIDHESWKQIWQIGSLKSHNNVRAAAISLGLQTRIWYRKNTSLKEDTQRFIQCSQDLFTSTQPFIEESNDDSLRGRVLQLHIQEWMKLKGMLADPGMQELCEAALTMSHDDRMKRLSQINSKRKKLKMASDDDREDLLSLLEEALALKVVSRKKILLDLLGASDVDDDVAITILADLHQEQIKDAVNWFSEEQISPRNIIEKFTFHMSLCENVFNILCKYEGKTGDQDLLEALYNRHALLRKKLLSSITEESERNKAMKELNAQLDAERDWLMKMLGDQDSGYLNEKERQAMLMKLRRSVLKAEQESKLDAAMLAGGLIMQQASAEKRLKSEQDQQRELALLRLAELKKRKLSSVVGDDVIVTEDRDAMQESVMRKMAALHKWEQHWLVVSCADNKPNVDLDLNEAVNQLISCRGRVKKGVAISLEEHSEVLNKSVALRLRVIGHELPGQPIDESEVRLMMMLQKMQEDGEIEVSEKFNSMSDSDLITEQEKLSSMLKMKTSSNLPQVLLWSSASDDDDLVEAIQDKLDILLKAAVTKAFQYKLGPEKQDTEEFRRGVQEVMRTSKEMMMSGHHEDALNLITEGLEKAQREEIIRMLMGDEDERRKRDLMMREQRRKIRIKNGMSEEEANRLFQEEGEEFESIEKKRRKNVLEGLFLDAEAEKNALLRMLQEANDKMEAERQRQLMLAKLRHQNKLLQRESELSMIMKLMNMSRSRDEMLQDERKRQLALARARVQALKNKKQSSKVEILTASDWSSDDRDVLVEAVTNEIEAKHAAERAALLQVMQMSGPGSDSRSKASEKKKEDRRDRIRALRQLRRQWRNDPALMEQKGEQSKIFQEASALQLESITKSNSSSEEDAQAVVLMDLQVAQDKETSQLISSIPEKDTSKLRELGKEQEKARIQGYHDNVASSLLGTNDEEEVIQALEDKYDAIKDKYLAEVLMKRLGSAEWEAMSERERQKRIMDVKRHEMRLRREGKTDELQRLFSALAISESGSERLSQEEKLKQRLERKKKLKEERASQGLSNDDATLERELDAEESLEKVKRKNVLLDLEANFENEKKSLLADLRRHDDMISEERKRQLAAAHLRRERRQLQSEQNYSAIMLLFQSANEDKAALTSNLEAGRAKQLALAKERLSVRKTKKRRKQALSALTDPEVILERINEIMDEKREGSCLDILLNEVEQKHLGERNALLQLHLVADDFTELSSRSNLELQEDLKKFMGSRRKWRESRMMLAINEGGDEGLDDAKRIRLSRYVATQNKLLIDGMKAQLEITRRALSSEVDQASWLSGQVEHWMTELQHTQDNETMTTTNLTFDKTDDVLGMLSEDQVRARRERWNDNLVKVLFGLPLPGQELRRPESTGSMESMEREQHALEDETEVKMKKLDQELEEKKQNIARKKIEGEEIDADAALAQLDKEFKLQKEALNSDLERQREKMRERLKQIRQRRDETEFEAHAAAGMVLLAEQRIKAREKRATDESSRQQNLMQQRLAARREQRKKAKEEKSEVHDNLQTKPPIQPMQREKTVLDIHVSEREKDDMLKELTRRSQIYVDTIKNEQERNRIKVRERISKKKEMKVAEVDKIMTKLEREKTMVQERKSLQLTRQKTILGERIERIKTEKTMTVHEKKKVSEFSKMAEEVGDKDQNKMEELARNLQKKLLEEKQEESTPVPAPKKEDLAPKQEEEEEGFRSRSGSRSGSRRLGKVDRDQIMKERMLKRKKQRMQEEGGKEENDPDADKDVDA